MPKLAASAVSDLADTLLMAQTGRRLKEIRKLTGLVQKQMAEACGTDQSQWSRWERGERLADVLVMLRFVRRSRSSLDLIYRGIPGGADPTLVRLLRQKVPDLVAPDPIHMEPDTDTALASYRKQLEEPQDAA